MKRFASDLLSLDLDEKTGHIAISYNNKRILESKDLFHLEWIENGVHSTTSRDMHVEARNKKDGFSLIWSKGGQQVITRIETACGQLTFHASVTLSHGCITKFQYPVFYTIDSIGDTPEEDYMLIPWQNGFVVNNPAKNLIARQSQQAFWAGRGGKMYENDYPAQFSFQFLYWYGPAGGLYICTDDGEARFKSYGLYCIDDNTFSFSIANYPEDCGEVMQYSVPYPIVLKGLNGDWQSAANEYRRFAIRQKWCAKGKLKNRKQSKLVYDVDLWRINHQHQAVGHNYRDYLDTSLKLQEYCNAHLGLHWYGWNQCRHDNNYPFYIKSSEKDRVSGELKAINAELTKHNIIKIPYVNARIVDMNCEEIEKLRPENYFIRDENGQSIHEPWNDIAKLVPMCPATDFWQDTVRDFCTDYFSLGFDGFYLDQIGSYYATRCYDRSHGHPLGGGSYWNEGYHRLIRKVRTSIGDDTILSTESCCETYIDVLDLMLILDQDMPLSGLPILAGMCNQNPVPLFNMIYGDYGKSYGSSNHFDIPYELYSYVLVRDLLWGFVPTIEGVTPEQLQRPDAEQRLSLLKETVGFYKKQKRDFYFGRLKRIPEIAGDTVSLTFPCMISGNYTVEIPKLLCSIWECEDGKDRLFGFYMDDKERVYKVDDIDLTVKDRGFFVMDLE